MSSIMRRRNGLIACSVMTIRKFAQKTQHDHVRQVKEFASYLKRGYTDR